MRRIALFITLTAFCNSTLLAHIDHNFYESQEVIVKTQKLTDNVYLLQGRGGNIAALTGMEGILIVDDDYKAVSEKLRDALKELGSDTPRIIFNTHWHGDHTEGNLFFGKGSLIFAQTNVRKRLSQVNTVFGETVQPYASFAWPM